ncbi:MAG: T9SS type A sorting domain-containing protein [Flavobacteriales bacterium]|nr:T9SS type A sorting domain-containing protein [Flavobacteriales bacterium]
MKLIVTLSATVGLALSALAQPQIINASFETWTSLGTGTEEPEEWSSIKTSDGGNFINNFAPQVCWQSADAHTGSYSVNVRTVQSAIGAANGIVTCGRVHAELNPANGRVFTEPSDAQWYQVMTSRPDSLVCWYKTTVMTGDYPTVDAIVHTGAGSMPENGTIGNWTGAASWDGASVTVGTWTRFSVPFNYFNGNAPEYVLVVMTSGDSLISQIGTQSWYDDMALIYNVSPVPSATFATVTAGLGFPLTVDFSTGGVPIAATDFVAELSDANGDFSNPVVIGTLNAAANTGSIACEIPAGTPSGLGYKIRVTNVSPYYAPLEAGIVIDLSTALAGATVGEAHVFFANGEMVVDLRNAQLNNPRYELMDMRGSVLRTGSLNSNSWNTLQVSVASGVYMVRLLHADGTTTMRTVRP